VASVRDYDPDGVRLVNPGRDLRAQSLVHSRAFGVCERIEHLSPAVSLGGVRGTHVPCQLWAAREVGGRDGRRARSSVVARTPMTGDAGLSDSL
jgi:hypothetical protein